MTVLKPVINKPWSSLVVVIATTAAAVIVRLVFLQALGTQAAFITFYPAVIISALYGGFWPGLLAAVFSAALADYFWIEPVGHFFMAQTAGWLSILVFLLSCSMISAITEAMHRAQARASRAEAMTRHPFDPQQAEREWIPGKHRRLSDRLDAIFPVNVAFPLAMAMIAALSVFAYSDIADMLETDKWEPRTQAVIRELDRLLTTLMETESAERGFLVTGDRKFVERYRHSVERVYGELSTLKELTQDNPRQQSLLQALETPIKNGLTKLEQTLTADQSDALQTRPAMLEANIDQDIRLLVDEIQMEEQRLLQSHSAQKAAETRKLIETGVLGVLLSFSMLIWIFFRLRREVAERVHAEAEVSAQRNRLKMMVDSLPQFIWTCLPDGRCDYTSPQLMDYSGVPEDELLGVAWLEQIHPADRELAYASWQDAVRRGVVYDVEYRIRRRDGIYRWFKTRAIPQRDDAGNIVKWFGSNTDINDLRQAEKELKAHHDQLESLVLQRTMELEQEIAEHARAEAIAKESEGKYRELVHEANSAIIRWQRDGTITFFNEYALSFFGYQASEVIGKDVRILIPVTESDGTDLIVLCDNILAHPENYVSHTNENVLSDGRRVWMTWSNKPIVGENGELVEILAVGCDVTERIHAEDALRQNEERMRLVLQASSTGTFEVDLLTGEGQWNSVEYELLGLKPGDARPIPETFFRYVHPDDIGHVQADWDEAQRAGNLDVEFRIIRADGEVRWLAGRGRFAFDSVPQGYVAGVGLARRFLGVNFDITERKLAVEALKEASRHKDEFLAMLAHELRNPLTPIMVAAQLLQKQGGENLSLVQWAGNTIKKQCDNLVQLVNQLLDVSRVTQGKIALQKATVDLREMIERAVESCKPFIEQHGHTLNVSLPPEPMLAEADAVRVEQAVGNLLNNAAKYTPDKGQIWVSLTSEADAAVIRVRDSGIGIAEPMIAKVFDLFTQADRTLDRAQGGLGIGLALVKSLVEMHGGSVKAHSEGIGFGAEFEVRLPRLLKPPIVSSDETAAHMPGVAKRILVVDDNDDVRVSTALLLRTLGHEVHDARDGEECLGIAKAVPVDVVLLDIGMPGMNGYEVARRLRQQPGLAGLTLIAMTGYNQDYNRQEWHKAGFDHYLVKPLDQSKLDTILASLTGP